MTLKEIKEMLETTGLHVAYREFPKKNAPKLPFICYLTTGSNNFSADGCVYHAISQISVELYTKNKDTSVETLVETALGGLFWQKDEEYLEDEECYEIIYTMEV